MNSWKELTLDPESLTQARLELHWAAQLIAAVGQALVKPRDDDSHRAMIWSPAWEGFEGEQLDDSSFRVGLRPDNLELGLIAGLETKQSFRLEESTVQDALEWLTHQTSSALQIERPELALPEFEIPEHPVGSGGMFSAPGAEFEELGRWYANANEVIGDVAREHDQSVRCWPHHFDIATLVTLEDTGNPETSKSVGVGMTPGDGSYSEPYFYVNPWPYPDTDNLPELEHGNWHTKGWVGAVLRGTELSKAKDPGKLVSDFVTGSVASATRLLRV